MQVGCVKIRNFRQITNSRVYKRNRLQFLLVVKATILRQQISKFYSPILSIEVSYHIYTTQWPVINVKANFCA